MHFMKGCNYAYITFGSSNYWMLCRDFDKKLSYQKGNNKK